MERREIEQFYKIQTGACLLCSELNLNGFSNQAREYMDLLLAGVGEFSKMIVLKNNANNSSADNTDNSKD